MTRTRHIAATLLITAIMAGGTTPTVAHAAAPPTVAHAAVTGRCPTYEAALRKYRPSGGWDVSRMSRYAYRESRCTPHVRSTTSDTGLLQINDVNLPWLSRYLRVPVTRDWLRNPTNNIRAAAALCTFWKKAGRGCYHPWKTS